MINNRWLIYALVILLFSAGIFVYSFSEKTTLKPLSLSEKFLSPFEKSSLLLPPKIQPEPEINPQSLSLFFVGDIMLDRNVWEKTKKADNDYNYPLAEFTAPDNFDLKIANLEGPITNFNPNPNPRRMTFTFSPRYLPVLQKNFNIVNLANNHTDNFGLKGLEQARAFLTSSSINYFGDPYNRIDYLATSTNIGGISIGFLGYNQLGKYDWLDILNTVQSLKLINQFVVIYPHWGSEYETKKPTRLQIQEAHELIETGADLIIGSHPHVIQPIEEYQGKLIFYSLGNFIFDQYFSPETMQGLAVGVYLTVVGNKIVPDYKLWPININKEFQPRLTVGEERVNILQNLSRYWLVNTSTKDLLLK